MTAAGYIHMPTAGARVRAELAATRRREPLLATFGLACGALGLAAFAAAAVDPRQFAGVPLWLKPAKFFVSVAVFSLSWAWLAGLVRAERRGARPMRVARLTLVASAAFELAYITLQAARGQASHFNTGDVTHALLYALMGLAAVALIGTAVPLAWAIARHPAPDADRDLRRAAVVGLALTFVLGGALGGYMSAQAGHAVGTEGGHARSSAGTAPAATCASRTSSGCTPSRCCRRSRSPARRSDATAAPPALARGRRVDGGDAARLRAGRRRAPVPVRLTAARGRIPAPRPAARPIRACGGSVGGPVAPRPRPPRPAPRPS
jgi:hypothetical protein